MYNIHPHYTAPKHTNMETDTNDLHEAMLGLCVARWHLKALMHVQFPKGSLIQSRHSQAIPKHTVAVAFVHKGKKVF